MAIPIFDTSFVQVVCISDTHNDDCTRQIPAGDIFIHAGDMTDGGSDKELKRAYDWISALPHKVKVIVAGNHDLGLDTNHAKFSQEGLDLFTSEEAQARGIQYLNRQTKVVAEYRNPKGEIYPIRVYGNPFTPDFLNSSYAFTYKPYPDVTATQAWSATPENPDGVSIWVMHGPPRHRLDAINIAGLKGCEAQAKAIAHARPELCVFGHYHFSYDLERVRWKTDVDEVGEAVILSKDQVSTEFDFAGNGPYDTLKQGQETVFVNAAWMTMKKGAVPERNAPFLVKLPVPK